MKGERGRVEEGKKREKEWKREKRREKKWKREKKERV